MNILLTTPQGPIFDRHFPPALLDRLRSLGELTVNKTDRHLTQAEVKGLIADTDIVLTHWGSVQYGEELLRCAPRLKLLAHCAGTVAHIASEGFFTRGIPVLSANSVMAKYVAEWVLGVMIASLRDLCFFDAQMRAGQWRTPQQLSRSLFDTECGLVGLGAVGRELLSLLAPFGCPVAVYDPYITADALAPFPHARLASFEEAMGCEIVSLHAAQTPETYHMINASALSMMPSGGLFINSARGSLVDTEALIAELETGRISAVLDVFEQENCPQDARLLSCTRQSLLQPHTAALPAGSRMTAAVIDDIERFLRGEKLQLAVTHGQYLRMTQE